MDEELQNLLIAAERRFRSTWSSYLTQFFFRGVRSLFICTIKLIFSLRDGFVLLLNGLHYVLLLPLEILIIIAYFAATFARDKANMSTSVATSSSKIVSLKIVRKLFWSGSAISVGRRLDQLNVPSDILQIRKESTHLAKNWQNTLPKTRVSFAASSEADINPRDYAVSSRRASSHAFNHSSSRPARFHSVSSEAHSSTRPKSNTNLPVGSKRKVVAKMLQEQMKKSLQVDDIEDMPGSSPDASFTNILPDTAAILPVDSSAFKVVGDHLKNGSRHHYGRRLHTKSAAILNKRSSHSD